MRPTATPGRVLESLHNDAVDHCVDVFVRDDGSFGYESYRRDVEDGGRWYPVGHYGTLVFPDPESALSHARKTVGWLAASSEFQGNNEDQQ